MSVLGQDRTLIEKHHYLIQSCQNPSFLYFNIWAIEQHRPLFPYWKKKQLRRINCTTFTFKFHCTWEWRKTMVLCNRFQVTKPQFGLLSRRTIFLRMRKFHLFFIKKTQIFHCSRSLQYYYSVYVINFEQEGVYKKVTTFCHGFRQDLLCFI